MKTRAIVLALQVKGFLRVLRGSSSRPLRFRVSALLTEKAFDHKERKAKQLDFKLRIADCGF
jgi:hypothetical protein